MRLILASASPRRAELLSRAGFTFDVRPTETDETVRDGEPPLEYVLRVARDKAAAAAAATAGRHSANEELILAADTTVVAAGRLLGKPVDRADARAMLTALSGAVHEVHTGVVLRAGASEIAEVETTRVRFVPLSDEEIEWYVATAEPDGKAGAYAIQDRGSRFVDWIEGSWSNVVGLPVATVYRMLKQAGVISSGKSVRT